MDSEIISKLGPRKLIKLTLGIIVLVLVVLLILGWYGIGPFKSSQTKQTKQTANWQAVFLVNGQVYFGHLTDDQNSKYLKLANIYYLQVGSSLQSADETKKEEEQAQNLNLIKLGDELHGPKDEMMINRDHVLFWENLRDDSKVVNSIKNYRP